MEVKEFEIIDADSFDPVAMTFLEQDTIHDKTEVILQWIQRLIVDADKAKLIDIAPPILLRVYNQLGNGIVNLNNVRKITDFPIPFPLAQMMTFMLLIHWVITALLCATLVPCPTGR